MKHKLMIAVIMYLLCMAFSVESFGQKRKPSHDAVGEKLRRRPSMSFPNDLENLNQKLHASGTTVKRGQTISQPFFSVVGRVLIVNHEQVQVFVYKTLQRVALEASRVGKTGSPIGTSMITWIAPPHFYRSGKMIILYVGENEDIISALNKALGEQFAGK